MTGSATISITRRRELWLHTGTACNLSCPFCHEGSKPADTRLQALLASEVAPIFEQATAQGIERFVFTGGEPLILRDILVILKHALQLRPVLVLTNGTAPFIRRSHQLASLRELPHALSFRVSIDYPDETQHDAGRGFRNFRKALEGLRLLHGAGFAVGITRQWQPGEDARAIGNRFRNLLRKQDMPEDLSVIALPQLGALETDGFPAAIVSKDAPAPTLCSRGRMLIKRAGSLQLTACALVDDDPAFDQAPELRSALASAVAPTHARCRLCLSGGVDYTGAAREA